MQAINQLVNQTLVTLASLPIQPSRESESQPNSNPAPVVSPYSATTWQQRWIGLDCYCESLKRLSEAAEHFCSRWYRNNPSPSMLVIYGEVGCGKTHTAKAISRFCRLSAFRAFCDGKGQSWKEKHIPGQLYVRWPEIAVEISENNRSSMEDMISVDLLLIDDIGAENDPWKKVADALCQVLSRRERKFTVITTNILPSEWPNRFESRIADRLLRNSEVISLEGVPSYALK